MFGQFRGTKAGEIIQGKKAEKSSLGSLYWTKVPGFAAIRDSGLPHECVLLSQESIEVWKPFIFQASAVPVLQAGGRAAS